MTKDYSTAFNRANATLYGLQYCSEICVVRQHIKPFTYLLYVHCSLGTL